MINSSVYLKVDDVGDVVAYVVDEPPPMVQIHGQGDVEDVNVDGDPPCSKLIEKAMLKCEASIIHRLVTQL
jgi:hypothetical protein